jgi:hypothetical protein
MYHSMRPLLVSKINQYILVRILYLFRGVQSSASIFILLKAKTGRFKEMISGFKINLTTSPVSKI